MWEKRRRGRVSTKTSIEDEIAHLRGLDLKGLRSRWQSVFRRSPPDHLPRHLLFAIVAYLPRTPRPFHFAFLHFLQSRRPSSRCTGVSGGRLIAARSTLLGVRQRLHFTSSHGNPPLIDCPIVGDGCAGPPSLHIFSFRRFSCKRSANIPVIARAFTSSLLRAFRSPPDSGVG
jgi:hypothetical protein